MQTMKGCYVRDNVGYSKWVLGVIIFVKVSTIPFICVPYHARTACQIPGPYISSTTSVPHHMKWWVWGALNITTHGCGVRYVRMNPAAMNEDLRVLSFLATPFFDIYLSFIKWIKASIGHVNKWKQLNNSPLRRRRGCQRSIALETVSTWTVSCRCWVWEVLRLLSWTTSRCN